MTPGHHPAHTAHCTATPHRVTPAPTRAKTKHVGCGPALELPPNKCAKSHLRTQRDGTCCQVSSKCSERQRPGALPTKECFWKKRGGKEKIRQGQGARLQLRKQQGSSSPASSGFSLENSGEDARKGRGGPSQRLRNWTVKNH